jgi:hypothetical protein
MVLDSSGSCVLQGYFRAADRPSGKDRFGRRFRANEEGFSHFAFRNASPQSLSGSIETVANLATPQTEYGVASPRGLPGGIH